MSLRNQLLILKIINNIWYSSKRASEISNLRTIINYVQFADGFLYALNELETTHGLGAQALYNQSLRPYDGFSEFDAGIILALNASKLTLPVQVRLRFNATVMSKQIEWQNFDQCIDFGTEILNAKRYLDTHCLWDAEVLHG